MTAKLAPPIDESKANQPESAGLKPKKKRRTPEECERDDAALLASGEPLATLPELYKADRNVFKLWARCQRAWYRDHSSPMTLRYVRRTATSPLRVCLSDYERARAIDALDEPRRLAAAAIRRARAEEQRAKDMADGKLRRELKANLQKALQDAKEKARQPPPPTRSRGPKPKPRPPEVYRARPAMRPGGVTILDDDVIEELDEAKRGPWR